jgi:hypothetical protein
MFAGFWATVGARDVLDVPLFLGLMLVAIAGAVLAGAQSPQIFRHLEQIEPFRLFAPWALSVAVLRRRLYARYVTRVRDHIRAARADVGETYWPLPIAAIASRQSRLETAPSPAIQILRSALSAASEARSHVLIESEGGRGKSALLRETVLESLAAFDANPQHALPVVITSTEGSLFDRARLALGIDSFSESLLRVLCQSGEFFLVVDGLTESTVTPQILRQHIAEFDTNCPLLLTSRPNAAHRDAIREASSWIVVESQPISDQMLTGFVRGYGYEIDDVRPMLERVCRSQDGSYLPILVRLALSTATTELTSVADVYHKAVRNLLKNDDHLFDAAVQLCLDTYWLTGERRLRYGTAPAERKAYLRRLLDAGLLVRVGVTRSDEPASVRFLHDSIQSYLTALGLMHRDDWRQILRTTAGDKRFLDDATGSSRRSSELFRMCVYVKGVDEDRNRLSVALAEELLEYAEMFAGALSRDAIVQSVALPALSSEIGARVDGGTALERAVAAARSQPDISPLSALYEAVVRMIWKQLSEREQTKLASMDVDDVRSGVGAGPRP